jgi:hypothetical protein
MLPEELHNNTSDLEQKTRIFLKNRLNGIVARYQFEGMLCFLEDYTFKADVRLAARPPDAHIGAV